MPGFSPVGATPVGAEISSSSGSSGASGRGIATASATAHGDLSGTNGQLLIAEQAVAIVSLANPGLFVSEQSVAVVMLLPQVMHTATGAATAELSATAAGQVRGYIGRGSAEASASASGVGQEKSYAGAGSAHASASAAASSTLVSTRGRGVAAAGGSAHGVTSILAFTAPGHASATATATATIRSVVRATGTAVATAVAMSGVQIEADAADTAIFSNLLSQSGGYAVSITNELTTTARVTAALGVVINERIKIALGAFPSWHTQITLSDNLTLTDAVRQLVRETITSTMDVHSVLTVQTLSQIVDKIKLSSALSAKAVFGTGIADELTLSEILVAAFGAELSDVIQLSVTQTPLYKAIANITSNLVIADELAPTWVLAGVILDGLDVTDITSPQMIFNSTIMDLILLDTSDPEPSNSLSMWQMNTRTAAVTEYSNYAFNSFARLGTQIYVGASDTGLYELTGDTDDGDPVIAAIRGGYMQFGGTHLSRLKAAYIAVRGAGEFVLKIIDGAGDEYIYSTCAQSMVTSKFNMGKGQRARYFAYELTSVGQDFDMDTLEFVPIEVQRRV